LPAFLLVLLTVSPLAVDAAVLDEAAGRAFLKLDSIVVAGFMLAAIRTGTHCGASRQIGRSAPA